MAAPHTRGTGESEERTPGTLFIRDVPPEVRRILRSAGEHASAGNDHLERGFSEGFDNIAGHTAAKALETAYPVHALPDALGPHLPAGVGLVQSQEDPDSEPFDPHWEDAVKRAISSPGQPLDPVTRATFPMRFCWDFQKVRIHTGKDADRSAQGVNALAYKLGNHVVFRDREFAPTLGKGQRLLAYELAHVLQQGAAGPERIPRSHFKARNAASASVSCMCCDHKCSAVSALRLVRSI
ncbi:MAG: DUF4157 domain-containing protein [Candidatus Solibacter sp.]|nr:DUF4157 domain-containing protein [Candidatus Solibacter sp.]